MTEVEWLASNDVHGMLRHLTHDDSYEIAGGLKRDSPLASARKLRLFAVACCFAAWGRLEPRAREALRRLSALPEGEWDAAAIDAVHSAAGHESGLCVRSACHPDPALAAGGAAIYAARVAPATGQAALLREIVGDPFRPVLRKCNDGCKVMTSGRGDKPHHCHTHGKDVVYVGTDKRTRYAVCPDSLEYFRYAHCTPDVMSLAAAAYEERQEDDTLDPARLMVLRDALMDVGCDCAAILDHLASRDAHVRGCWALDLILGKY